MRVFAYTNVVLELTRREAGRMAMCWKFMSFQENLGIGNNDAYGRRERHREKSEQKGKERKEKRREEHEGLLEFRKH